MLSTPAPLTSRPRPPGRLNKRRSSLSFPEPALNTTADSVHIIDNPPPYRKSESMDLILADDVFLDNSTPSSIIGELDDQWVKDKSKEELSQLLLKAEGIIHRRQHELTLAALVGKELLQRNMDLKAKYDGVLSRLPLSPSNSQELPRNKRTVSWQTDDDEDDELGYSLREAKPSFMNDTMTPTQRRFNDNSHHISASPSAVAFLHSQNETLLSRLATIEKETAQAELEGKQNLKALEREIAALNMELESSRQRALELEDEMKAKAKLQSRKAVESARLKALRDGQTSRSQPDNDAPKMDFAPSSQWTTLRSPTILEGPPSVAFDDDASSVELCAVADTSIDAMRSSETQQERKVIRQLWQKISELETANKELLTRHLDTRTKLDRASKDADALGSVFDTIERDEIFEESLLHESSTSSSISSIRHSRNSSHSGIRTLKRKARPRSIASFQAPKSPINQKSSSQSPRTPFSSSSSLSMSSSASLIDSPSFNRIGIKTKHLRTTLHDELNNALRATLSYDSGLSTPTQRSDDDGLLSFPRSESQIDAAVFALRQDASRHLKSASFPLTAFPLSSEIDRSPSPGPTLPGFYHSPERSAIALPMLENTPKPLRHTSLRKSSSLGDISSQARYDNLRLRRKVSQRIEGLDLAAIVDDEDDPSVNGSAQATAQRNPQAWTTLLMEVWIILQFCVVLVIFVFTVARKGPRGVIQQAKT